MKKLPITLFNKEMNEILIMKMLDVVEISYFNIFRKKSIFMIQCKLKSEQNLPSYLRSKCQKWAQYWYTLGVVNKFSLNSEQSIDLTLAFGFCTNFYQVYSFLLHFIQWVFWWIKSNFINDEIKAVFILKKDESILIKLQRHQ